MRVVFKPLIFAFLGVQDAIIRLLTRRVWTHKFLLAPGIEPLRWRLGRLRAWRTFNFAARRVPAYRGFLHARGVHTSLEGHGKLDERFAEIPPIDKESYIREWSVSDRCVNGRVPRRGVVVDESSGSSGKPTSWVRGPEERLATRQLLQVGYWRTSQTLKKQPFVLNAFSLGAWATGMNVSASLTEVTMMKSVGPDPDKIIATMQEFGPHYTYVILSYPPFLKSLFDDPRINWRDYDIVTAFGGEGISENMRALITEYAHSAYGSYGASDLEINIAIETDFTVALRQAIAADPELSARLTKTAEYGVLPMVFQFNPFDYLMEESPDGELLVTINRKTNISPRIRYNIHDRGHVLRLRDLKPILSDFRLERLHQVRNLDLPLLFLYGRSDLSVDFNGAVVAPDTLRDVIFGDPALAAEVENHRLISYEDAKGNRQLHLALQLNEGSAGLDEAKVAAQVFAAMREANGDFSNAIRTSSAATLPTLGVYTYRTGPFVEDGRKLKNEYVWTLAADELKQWKLRTTTKASKG